jgi:hypothetical protein
MIAPDLVYGWPRGTVRSIIDGLSGPSPLAIDLGEGKAIHRALEMRFEEVEPGFDLDLQDLLMRGLAPIAPLAEEPGDIDGVMIEGASFLAQHGSIDAVIAAARLYGDYRRRIAEERERAPGYITRRAFEIATEMGRECRDCSTTTPMAGGRLVLFLEDEFMGVHHWAEGDPEPIHYKVPIRMEFGGRGRSRAPRQPQTA